MIYKILLLSSLSLLVISCTEPLGSEQVESTVNNSLDQMMTEALDAMETNTDRSIELCAKVINEAQDRQLLHYSGKAKWYMGYIYDDIVQDASRAYFYYNEAIKDLKTTEDYSLLHSVYLNLGELNRINGQLNKSIKLYEEALLFEDEYSDEELADLYYNYGIVLKLKGTNSYFQKAQEAIESSLAYAKSANNYEDIARVNNQIGLMYKDIGNYEMSRIAYQNTIRDYSGVADLKEFAGLAYHGIGVTYMEEENWEQAIKAFNSALQYKTDSRSRFVSKYDLGTVLMKSGQNQEAVNTWKGALAEDHNKNSLEHVKIYSLLTRALSAQNKHEEALAYAEIYNDNIQNILDGTEVASGNEQLVLFQDIVKEYEEFVTPSRVTSFIGIDSFVWFTALALMTILAVGFIYRRQRVQNAGTIDYEELKNRFEQFKVD